MFYLYFNGIIFKKLLIFFYFLEFCFPFVGNDSKPGFRDITPKTRFGGCNFVAPYYSSLLEDTHREKYESIFFLLKFLSYPHNAPPANLTQRNSGRGRTPVRHIGRASQPPLAAIQRQTHWRRCTTIWPRDFDRPRASAFTSGRSVIAGARVLRIVRALSVPRPPPHGSPHRGFQATATSARHTREGDRPVAENI